MRRLIAASILLIVNCAAVSAQAPELTTGCVYNNAGITITDKNRAALQCDATGALRTSASVSASITPFEPSSATTLSVSAVSSNVALPSGTTTTLCNNTATNAYYKFGNAAVTAATTDNIIFGGECIALAPGTGTYIAGITASGTTGFNISGGSGLPTFAFGPAAAVSSNLAQIGGNTVAVGNGVSGTGVQRVTIASDSTGQINAVQSGTWNIGSVTTLPALATGSNVIGAVTQSGTWTVQPGNTANTTPWLTRPSDGTNNAAIKAASTAAVAADPALVVAVSPNNTIPVAPTAATTGGASMHHTLSAASTNATNVKNAAGTLYSITAVNTTATVYYLKFYNTSAAPTCNTDTVQLTFPIPAATAGNGLTINPAVGFAFGTGISFCLTGAQADNDNTNAATGVTISLGYK